MGRLHEEMQLSYTGRRFPPESGNSGLWSDMAYAFFVACYHLRDWLLQDPRVVKDELDKFIADDQSLSLCRDICNGSKHAVLTRARSTDDARLGRQHVTVGGTAGSAYRWTVTYVDIATNEARGRDALELADACMARWEVFRVERVLPRPMPGG
jgi:hypothetical protein